MQTITFSSDRLPSHLSDKQRFSLWCELHYANVAELDYGRSEAPFQAHLTFAEFGSVGLGHMSGSIVRATHDRPRSSSRTSDHLGLVISEGDGAIQVRCRSRDSLISSGASVLVSPIEAEEFATNCDHAAWTLLRVPRAALVRAVPGAEDLVGTALKSDSDALRLLRGYAELSSRSEVSSPQLQASIGQTLTDLIALALGAGKDATEIASQRGLKSARLESILQAIADGYSDPEFSVAGVARKLRVSERYVQDVLHGTGQSFCERVMELRLQHAARLLAGAADRDRKVSDIAFSSGFNDLSYFHRCYRRRFGMTPAGARVH